MFQLGEKRLSLLRWNAAFYLGNVILCWLVGIEYLSTTPWITSQYLQLHGKAILGIFVVFSYLGQLALMAFIPSLIIIPLILMIPIRRLIFILSVILASAVVLWLSVDSILYNLYRFHLNGIVLKLTLNGLGENIFGLSNYEMFLVLLFTAVLLSVEAWLALWLWHRRSRKLFFYTSFKWYALFIVSSLYVSYSMIVFSVNLTMNRFFIDCARFLPFYYEVVGSFLPMKNAGVELSHLNAMRTEQPEKKNSPLHYPLQSINYSANRNRPNILMIIIDSWRFDMLTKDVMPNVFQFANQSWNFTKHFSGGNATGPGIFSLFYSIPATYWTAMEKQQRSPVFIETLLKQHYQTKMLASAGLQTPALDHTVFQAILPMDAMKSQLGETPNIRDSQVTKSFKKFISEDTKLTQPFFSFLLYDSAHSFCAGTENTEPFTPAAAECVRFSLTNKKDSALYFNRYKNAVHFIDKEIAEVIQTLKTKNLLDNTVIIITGDHGEEFDDNHQGYFGHAGNFTPYQVQTPLIAYFPGEKPQIFTHQTSHFDIVPTLMTHVLGVTNPITAYSVGTQLLDETLRSYLIVSSYIDFGVIEPDR
ncbi:MAG TPA: DUF3413 domain-containing protein, partial [Gammaproteobacteria bacterium]|nr:DUF3413 domain-containing protein [Gammaproteobacteria bacterium]